ncbi:hypothetical protein QZH41_012290, partial [Actinostola sp. cb2023]
PKFAVTAIKKKMFDKNPHVAKFALTVLEACIKNCGSGFHDEIATKEFMEEMRNLIRVGIVQFLPSTYVIITIFLSGQEPVKEKALGLIQTCSHAFRNETKYKIIQDTFNLMKMEGCQFPAFSESDAMFSADCAPAWAEGEVCHMCRVKFGTFMRQHHCRKCGQVFCRKCSSKESIIPQFGIEREVRVCDPCYFQLNPQSKTEKGEKSEKSPDGIDLPPEYLNSHLSKESQTKPLARSWPSSPSVSSNGSSSSTSQLYSSSMYGEEADSPDMDPDLARYLNRSYWEGRKEQQSSGYTPPSAPEPQNNDRIYATPAPYSNHTEPKLASKVKKKKTADHKVKDKSYTFLEKTANQYSEEQVSEAEQSSETMVNNFESSLGMLSERMQTLSGKGKHIAMDATVQSLFQTVSAMHPQLLRMIEQQEEETGKYEALKERLGLVKEARATLDDARDQHREKVRQQELEQDMLRRMQIEQKLELMRQQKAEYMAYQQRLQTERQMALEQQHQQLLYQKYGPQQFAGQYVVADGSVPYSSMGYIPPSSLPPPGVTQTDGSPYSSLNYIPSSSMPPAGVPITTSSIPGPTAPGGPNDMSKGTQQPPYNQSAPQLQQGYVSQGYPGMVENSAMMENPARSQSPHFGQAPPSYSQVDYAHYGSDVTNSLSMVNGQPSNQQVPDYLQPEQIPNSAYQQSHPGQPILTQQAYTSPLSSSSSYLPQAPPPPPQYAQATNQPPAQQAPPNYDGNQQVLPPQGNPQVSPPQPQHQLPPQTSYGNQQPQYAQQHQGSIQQPDPSGFPQPHMQQQQALQQQQPLPPSHQQQQPPHHQQPPPSHQQQPPSQQQQPPSQQQPPPSHQQQQQPPPHQQQQQPPPSHQQQQMYEPQPQQYQTGAPYSNPQQFQQQPPQNQYYQQQPPSGPPTQRQMSDLELISFD